jgi:hypothetical protein
VTNLDQKTLLTILEEIDSHLNRGILPVHNGHLQDLSGAENILDCLMLMKSQGLISGDLVTKGTNSLPYRMTNIRLTYLGIKVLRS